MPTGTVALNDISGFDAQPGDVYAVGAKGTLLEFNPSSVTSCSTGGGGNQCLAEVLGGPVFNGNSLNLQSGLFQRDGNFTQYGSTNGCGSAPPSGLVIGGGNQYCTANSVPNSINPTISGPGGLHEPLPTTCLISATNGGPIVASGNADWLHAQRLHSR